jgi:hypothetical protein
MNLASWAGTVNQAVTESSIYGAKKLVHIFNLTPLQIMLHAKRFFACLVTGAGDFT